MRKLFLKAALLTFGVVAAGCGEGMQGQDTLDGQAPDSVVARQDAITGCYPIGTKLKAIRKTNIIPYYGWLTYFPIPAGTTMETTVSCPASFGYVVHEHYSDITGYIVGADLAVQ